MKKQLIRRSMAKKLICDVKLCDKAFQFNVTHLAGKTMLFSDDKRSCPDFDMSEISGEQQIH